MVRNNETAKNLIEILSLLTYSTKKFTCPDYWLQIQKHLKMPSASGIKHRLQKKNLQIKFWSYVYRHNYAHCLKIFKKIKKTSSNNSFERVFGRKYKKKSWKCSVSLKVSKNWKEISKFSFEPKNERTISALVQKSRAEIFVPY